MNEFKQAVITFYRGGHTAIEIVKLRQHLSSAHRLGSGWKAASQRSINQWLKQARDADPDLVIWHHLNRRRRKPGVYTNWRRDGLILLPHFYDPMTDTLYRGTGVRFEPPPGSKDPRNIIPSDKELKKEEQKRLRRLGRPGNPDSDAVGPYVAELHDAFGYSSRDIVKLWKKRKTRHPATDREPRVVWLSEQLRGVRSAAMGHTTVNRILKKYGYIQSNLESVEQGDT